MSYRTTSPQKITICSKCGRDFRGWEDSICSGEFRISHSCCIGDVFSEGVVGHDVEKQRQYCRDHPIIKNDKAQELILEYGGDNGYTLCWHCHRDLLVMLGKFFVSNEDFSKEA